MKIAEILAAESVCADLNARGKVEVLKELIQLVAQAHRSINREEYLTILMERERLGSTGVGDGVAIPHGKVRGGNQVIAAFGRSKTGVDFDAIDDKKSHLFLLLMAPDNSAGLHLKALAKVSRMLKRAETRQALMETADADEIYRILTSED
ncbi:MAG: PTS sugar transporter subunit IIA [Candidatus Alcyoniella australis]|nr:PTS sugar transporter subunit IIA [Candidatus Alcyoniella australis]